MRYAFLGRIPEKRCLSQCIVFGYVLLMLYYWHINSDKMANGLSYRFCHYKVVIFPFINDKHLWEDIWRLCVILFYIKLLPTTVGIRLWFLNGIIITGVQINNVDFQFPYSSTFIN